MLAKNYLIEGHLLRRLTLTIAEIESAETSK